jgi:hypothetical protein
MKVSLSFIVCLLLVGSVIGQSDRGRRLLDTPNHVVTAYIAGNDVVFVMEAVSDLTQDRNDMPLGKGWDYAGIRVDINNNNVVDEMVDIAFGTRQKTNIFCGQYLISEVASTGCGGYRSKGRVKIDFSATPIQSAPHPVYVYRIPLSELNAGGGKIGLVFRFGEPTEGRSFYPSARRALSFHETIQLDLSELR